MPQPTLAGSSLPPKPASRHAHAAPQFLSRLGLALAIGLATCLAGVPASAATPPASYEFVELSGNIHVASGLVFSPDGVRAALPSGVKAFTTDELDWYETFYRNIRSGATNVVVFQAGSLLRFDKLELKAGLITLTMGGGGTVTLAESLIDFEASVREGAMVKLPEGAAPAVQVSRSAGGAYVPAMGAPEDAGSRRRASAASRRRAGGGIPTSPRESVDEVLIEPEMDQDWQDPPEQAQEDVQQPDEDALPGRAGRTPFPRRASPGGDERPPEEDSENQATGQATVAISSDYSGIIGGLQVQLQYPPNIQVIEPVNFSGFATGWLATPNTQVPGQISIGGAAQPGTTVSGGEFLRINFVWSGSPPPRQLFRIAQLTAVGENSESLLDFRTTMEVVIAP